MTRAVTFAFAAALAVAADPPAKKEDVADKARKQFYQCWLEIEEVEAGVRVTDPAKLVGIEYTAEHRSAWGRRLTGEMSASLEKPGPRIDPTADPMRVEFVGRGRSRNFDGDKGDEMVNVVRPCIFKFEDGNLIIAYAERRVVEKEFKKGEDYPERPKDFTSTKENKRTVTTMKPCSFWDQD